MITNRALCEAVRGVARLASTSGRQLEEYLRSLLSVTEVYCKLPSLSPAEFLASLGDALTAEAVPFSEGWAQTYPELLAKGAGFEGWRQTAIRQVVDLRDMAATAVLKNPLRFVTGVAAPEGLYWYNFDVASYLECGVSGTWEDRADPDAAIAQVDWADFTVFLECGQSYE